MFIGHYNSQLNRVIQSTNYHFNSMKYINSILKHHKTRKMKSDLTENERRDKYKQETFHILFLLFKKEN